MWARTLWQDLFVTIVAGDWRASCTIGQEVEGLEVYTGPAETPPELESAQARCGVVVIWTRTPPPRRPKEKKPKKPPAEAPAPRDTVSGLLRA